VQNNNNARSGFTLKKISGMVSNLLKRWRDDFAAVKRQRDGFVAFRKGTECHPASPQVLPVASVNVILRLSPSWKEHGLRMVEAKVMNKDESMPI
jgi:hypothetical protein